MVLEVLVARTWDEYAVLHVIENEDGATVFGTRREDGKDAQVLSLTAHEWAEIQDDVRSVWRVEDANPIETAGILAIRDRSIGASISGELAEPRQLQLRFGLTTWAVFETRLEEQSFIVTSFLRRDAGDSATRDDRRGELVSHLRTVHNLETFDLEKFTTARGWPMRAVEPYDFDLAPGVFNEALEQYRLRGRREQFDVVHDAVIAKYARAALESGMLSGSIRKQLTARLAEISANAAGREERARIDAGVGQNPFDERRFIGALSAVEGELTVYERGSRDFSVLEGTLRALLAIPPLDQWPSTSTSGIETLLGRVRRELSALQQPGMHPARIVLGHLVDHSEKIWSNCRRTKWDLASGRARVLLHEAYGHTKRDT